MSHARGDVHHSRISDLCQHVIWVMVLAGLIVMLVASSIWSEEKMRWIENNPDKVAKGKSLFTACGACHGMQGEGRQGIGPRLNSDTFLAAASDDFLVRTISQGRAGTTMIPWGLPSKMRTFRT